MISRHLREAFDRFCRRPAEEACLAAFFLLAACTGILLGPAALAYFWHHNPANLSPPPASTLLLMQRLQGAPRTATSFWIGFGIWLLAALPACAHPLLGLPLWMLLMQPLWLALLLTDRFDLSLPTALKATGCFLLGAPQQAFTLMLFGLLALSGIGLLGIGILITHPLFTRAQLTYLDTCTLELAAAIQRAS